MHVLPLTRRGLLSLSGAASLVPLSPGPRARPGGTSLIALSYHEVGEDARGHHYSISQSRLTQHLAWLRETGWTAVSLGDLIAARDGRRELPGKAVLLTFDDGYDDHYSRVFPLLRAFRWPGVFALVTSWMETPADGSFDFGGVALPRRSLMTWAQAREMQASGLCEFACHTHDLHRGIRGNPQGNLQPALVTRHFDPATGLYEPDVVWRRRIEADTRRSVGLMEARLGRRPRCMVWPYGRYNMEAAAVARDAGLPLALTLDPEPVRPDRLDQVGRVLLMEDPTVADLARAMRSSPSPGERVVHVDLDYVHDENLVQQERNLDALVERIAQLSPSTVYLQAFADPDGDGVAEALYFPNRHLPMRADLFNRVAWQLSSRTGVEVYAWMPVLGFAARDDAELVLSAERPGQPAVAPGQYRRLSPFQPALRARIGEIYEDLAKHAHFAGLLFHDDAFLSDFEDASPAGLQAAHAAGLPRDLAALRADPGTLAAWTRFKTQALVDLTLELAARARRWRTPLRTARNLFARPVLDPAAEGWMAQSLPAFLTAYDRTALMAMPLMEGAADVNAFLRDLVGRVAAQPEGLARTVFELQAVDWRGGASRPVPAHTLRTQLRMLARLGVRHMGWYPDDFIRNQPEVDVMRDAISTRSFPARP